MRDDTQGEVSARMILGLGALTLLALLVWRPETSGDAAEIVPSASQSIRIDKASKLWLEGDSTLHKYRLDAMGLDVRMGEGAAGGSTGIEGLAEHGGIKSLDVRVAVAKLTSGEGGLDDNMRKALSWRSFRKSASRWIPTGLRPTRRARVCRSSSRGVCRSPESRSR